MVQLTPTAYWRGQVDGKLTALEDTVDEHDLRIGVIEKFMWKIVGASLVGSVLGGGIVTVIAYLIVGAINHH